MLTVDECTVRPYLQSFSFDPLGIQIISSLSQSQSLSLGTFLVQPLLTTIFLSRQRQDPKKQPRVIARTIMFSTPTNPPTTRPPPPRTLDFCNSHIKQRGTFFVYLKSSGGEASKFHKGGEYLFSSAGSHSFSSSTTRAARST